MLVMIDRRYQTVVLIGVLILSACDAVIGEPVLEIPGLAQTLAAQTMEADQQIANLHNTPTQIPPSATASKPNDPATQIAAATPEAKLSQEDNPSPTLTPIPTLTPELTTLIDSPELATPLDPDAPCLAAEFIRDVTIPDDVIIKPNTEFTKIWALRNIGTCTWKKDEYALVMYWGHQMGTEPPIPLAMDVVPGQTAELAVDMVSPYVPGCWQSNWMLQDGEGNRFGIGPNYGNYFWVSVTVWWPKIPKVFGVG